MEIITTNGRIGTPHWRIEGMAKVTGKALYGADQKPFLNADDRAFQTTDERSVNGPAADEFAAGGPLAYAAVLTSPIATGRIRSLDDAPARALPGVLGVFTYKNVGKEVKAGKPLLEHGYMAQANAPLASRRIYFQDQIVAVVVAESEETALEAAALIQVAYKAEVPAPSFDSAQARVVKAKALGDTEVKAGDVDAALSEAAAVIDAWYETPPQHHNALELFQTTCAWRKDAEGKDQLVVWESTQNTRGFQYGIAKQLGLKPAQVRVVSPFIGGAFGSRGELGQYTALMALAARELQRPVKFVAGRRHSFSLRTHRAETRHHLRLGADAEGRLLGLDHESWELCSRSDRFAVAGSDSTSRLYAVKNVRTMVHNVEADRPAPGFMRAPPEMPYLFAMESAMDELSYALHLDPVELRRRNDTQVELASNRPYTSRSLLRCLERGEALFGWEQRTPEPRSMATEEELVGWGFATAFYPAQIGPAHCRITLETAAEGFTAHPRALVEVGTHEFGTGVRTLVAMTVADLLGLPMDAIETRIGDSSLPAAPLSAGSNSTATICNVLAKCCEELRDRLARAASADKRSPLYQCDPALIRLIDGFAVFTHDPEATHARRAGEVPEDTGPAAPSEPLVATVRRVGRGRQLVQKTTHTPHGLPPVIGPALVNRGMPLMIGGSNVKDRMQFAHGAHFVEVRISRTTGEIRVPRMVGVFAFGRVMNPRTAFAQLQGGQVWGMSSALRESTEVDPLLARYANADLAEYHLPVCRDVGDITTVMLDEEDTEVNPLGIKGVGELGVTGLAAAIANAVFHATGRRVRQLPLRLDDVLPVLQ